MVKNNPELLKQILVSSHDLDAPPLYKCAQENYNEGIELILDALKKHLDLREDVIFQRNYAFCSALNFCANNNNNDGMKMILDLVKDDKALLMKVLVSSDDIYNLPLSICAQGNNNEGINTGSMGSYVPVKLTDGKKALINKYVKKLEEVFQEVKPNFTGVFASDLIFTEENIYNLEFNMRPCTPEFEVLIEHIDSDLLEIMYKTAVSELEGVEINYKPGITGAVNVVHKDYKYFPNIVETRKIKIPKNFLKGSKDIVINFNIKDIDEKGNAKIYTNINIFVIMKNDSKNPFPDLYEYISRIKDKNIYYRTDIGEN